MKKNILITGGAGFVGANLTRRLLAEGHSVNLLLREGTDLRRLPDIQNKVNILRGDLLDSDRLKKQLKDLRPEIIFHLAQYGGYSNQKDSQKIIETNFIGTKNLLDAAEAAGFEKFINTGSSSEYGNKQGPMSETDLLEPNSVYAVSKAAGTLYCQHRGRDAGLPIINLRLFSAYGPWEEPGRLIPTIILRLLRGQPLELVSPAIARDFVYINDIADAYLAAMNVKEAKGEIINICSGKQTTLGELAETALEIAKVNAEIKWGAYEKRSYDTDVWVGNPDRAEKMLGWKAGISLKDGLRKTIDWIKENKNFYENRS